VKPTWGGLNIRAVRTTSVELWIRQLMRLDGSRAAPSTKAKASSFPSGALDRIVMLLGVAFREIITQNP